jgi:hypothetical protein
MVARTLPFKARDPPDEDLPSITKEIQRRAEAEQKASANNSGTRNSSWT